MFCADRIFAFALLEVCEFQHLPFSYTSLNLGAKVSIFSRHQTIFDKLSKVCLICEILLQIGFGHLLSPQPVKINKINCQPSSGHF